MLEWTGERYLPWLRGVGAEIHYEHLQRYAFALQFAKGKRVIDLGCGEGYGSFLLASEAAEVVGVDIDRETVRHAQGRYGHLRQNLAFKEGSIIEVPITESHTFDVALCFETLEHVSDHERLVGEAKRLLTSGGRFVVSTPNKYAYSDKPGYRNQFHVKELYFDEFERLLADTFQHVVILGQRVYAGSSTWALCGGSRGYGDEVVVEPGPQGYRYGTPEQKEPMYFIGVASDVPFPPSMATENRLVDVSNGYVEGFVELHVNPRIQALQDEAERLRIALEEYRAQIPQKDAQLATLQSESARLEAELGAKQNEVTELLVLSKAKDDEVQHERATREQLEADLVASQAVTERRLQPSTGDGQLRQLREMLDRLTGHLREVESRLPPRVDAVPRATALLRRLTTPPTVAKRGQLQVVVDTPLLDGDSVQGAVSITGWAAGSNPVERVEVYCDGELLGLAHLGLARPDVAAEHGGLVAAAESGFALVWDATGGRPGRHVLSVRAIDSQARVAERTGSVEVEPTLLVRLDEPSVDHPVSGKVTIAGWAAGSTQIVRVDVTCDGCQVGVTGVGLPRPDVAHSYENPAWERSGYSLSWDATLLPAGPHTLTVTALDARGQTAEVERVLNVEPSLCLVIDEPPPDSASAWVPLRVAGWAAGPSPVVRVEVLCDGDPLGLAELGLLRPDVAAAHPDLIEGSRAGFALSLASWSFGSGLHTLTAKAADARGRLTTVTRQVLVKEASGRSVSSEGVGASARRRSLVQRPTCRRFALYVSSLGNYFFGEIRDLLLAGLEELGFDVEVRNERDGFSQEVDWHIVVAPHEFFYLGAGKDLRGQMPTRSIVLNTEQPSTQWFSRAFERFSEAHAVWDINYECSRFIESRGYACRYVTLGYTPGFQAAQPVARLPEHYGTQFLEDEILGESSAGRPFAQRPIDVLFVGHASRRRERFFAQAAAALSHHRCYLHLGSASSPVIPGQTTHMDTSTVIGLAQRSKILLNIHHGEDRYFEWHRIVLGGIWQKALVLSEPCSVAPPFRAGVDFVEVPLDEIPEAIDYYLSTGEGSNQANEIIRQGFHTLTQECRLSQCLKELILELNDVPRFPRKFALGVTDNDLRPVSVDRAPLEGATDGGFLTGTVRSTDAEAQERTADVREARQLLLTSTDLSDEEKHVLGAISLDMHPADEMYAPAEGGHHYLSVGLSASRCVRAALRSAQRDAVGAILDFPCGHGRVLRFLKAMFPDSDITGGEIHPGALDFSQRAFAIETFLSGTDFTSLSLPTKFDLIWCGSLLTHLDEERSLSLLRFFHRHLSEQGLCVFTTHGQRSVEWMRQQHYTYGLSDAGQRKVLTEFDVKDYGYADYDGQPGYGISVVSHARVVQLARAAGAWDEVLYLEHGWADHQDVYAFASRAEAVASPDESFDAVEASTFTSGAMG